jgi:hypothetical protein
MKAKRSFSIISFALSLLLLSVPGTSRAQNLFVANSSEPSKWYCYVVIIMYTGGDNLNAFSRCFSQ